MYVISIFIFFFVFFFFFNDTATTEIYTRPYTLSLHDALPISSPVLRRSRRAQRRGRPPERDLRGAAQRTRHAPGVPAPARQWKTGHGQHQDPRHRARWRRQAAPTEGHRPREARQHARAEHEGGRQRVRPEAPRLLPKDAEADAPPRPAQRPQPEGDRGK